MHPDHPADGLKLSFGNAPTHAAALDLAGADWAARDRCGGLLPARQGALYTAERKPRPTARWQI